MAPVYNGIGMPYTVSVDWTNTGTFVDITADVRNIQCTNGITDLLRQHIANVGKCVITVKNTSRNYSPEYASSPYFGNLKPRRPVKIVWNYRNAIGTLFVVPAFYGYIDSIEPESGDKGTRQSVITCSDLIGVLQTSKIALPLFQGWTTDALVAGLVSTAMGMAHRQISVTFLIDAVNGDTLTITTASGAVYVLTFTTASPATVANTVQIGGAPIATAFNLYLALNQLDGLNTVYGPITPPPYMTFLPGTNFVVFTHVFAGTHNTTFTITTSNPTNISIGAAFVGTDYNGGGTASYQAGRLTVPNAGHNWQSFKTSALSAIEEVTRAENGYFVAGADGAPKFYNQQWYFSLPSTADALTINNNGPSMKGSSDIKEVLNSIHVMTTPVIPQASGVIGISTAKVAIPPATSVKVRLAYVNPTTGKPSGASSVVFPLVPSTDWKANDKADGTGVDYTLLGNLTLTYAPYASGLDVNILNNTKVTLYMTKLQVRGIALSFDNPVESVADDSTSQTDNQLSTYQFDMSLSDDLLYANELANYILNKYKNAAFRVKTLKFQATYGGGPPNYGVQPAINGVNLVFGSPMTVTDFQMALTNHRYVVTGFSWSMDVPGAAPLNLEIYVYRLDDQTYWILGDATYGVLGTTTRLAI